MYEYFHGASHQTCWTGCIALIIQVNGEVTEQIMSGADAERATRKASARTQRKRAGRGK